MISLVICDKIQMLSRLRSGWWVTSTGRDKNERSWMDVRSHEFSVSSRLGEEYELEVYVPVFG